MEISVDPARYPSALMRHIGFDRVLALEPDGQARVAFTARPEFTHSQGTTVQGGIVTAWLDCAMAWAVTARDPASGVASLEIKMSFIARVGPGPYVAEARVLKWGRSGIVFLEAELLDARGKVHARASSTGMAG